MTIPNPSPVRYINPFDEAGNDKGWIEKGHHLWWNMPAFEHAFTFFDTSAAYPDVYYDGDHGVTPDHVTAYVDVLFAAHAKITGRKLRNVLEVGCGGGWFTEELLRRGLQTYAFDGSESAVRRTALRCKKWLIGEDAPAHIFQCDARTFHHVPTSQLMGFDAICCSEVAEHIEPPLAGMFVQNLTRAADFILWSHARPGEHAPAHLHHPNEQPDQYWINLFAYFGFEAVKLPAEAEKATKYRAKYVFMRRGRWPGAKI